MRKAIRQSVSLVVLLWIASVEAGVPSKQLRLEADLDGDGRVDVIVLKATAETDFGKYEITVGNGSFQGEYFAAFGEIPSVSVVKLDSQTRTKELYVTLRGAAMCTFEFLAYDGKDIHRLGTLKSAHCLETPRIYGNGEVTIEKWEGFWVSTRRFRLTGEPKRLDPVQQRFYDLDVRGVAEKRFPLYSEESNTPVAHVDRGHRLSIKRFDAQTETYLIVVDGQTQGWAKITPEHIRDLPWAN
jgi:hypothetical protein